MTSSVFLAEFVTACQAVKRFPFLATPRGSLLSGGGYAPLVSSDARRGDAMSGAPSTPPPPRLDGWPAGPEVAGGTATLPPRHPSCFFVWL